MLSRVASHVKIKTTSKLKTTKTSTMPSRSCGAGVRLFVFGMVLEDGHVREVYILYLSFFLNLILFILFHLVLFFSSHLPSKNQSSICCLYL